VRFRQATVIAATVVVVVGGGAAAYALTTGASRTPTFEKSGGQIQGCLSQANALYVTNAHPKKCPKGMIPVQVAGPDVQLSSSPAQPSVSPSSPRSASPSPSRSRRSSSPSPSRRSSSPPPSAPPPSAPPPASSGKYACDYHTDTWSGDAASVGYSVQKISSADGKTASFSVRLNANRGTTEVVGYPSDQCLIYSALPGSLTSSYSVTPPGNSSGLDYEFAYDIWLTSASAASSNNWNNDLELMIWTYVKGQRPAGSRVATLGNGSAVWFAGTKGSNNSTVSVVLPSNTTSGTVGIAGMVSQLKALGYIPSSDNGILDVEYGIEAPYGGGNAFAVNAVSVAG